MRASQRYRRRSTRLVVMMAAALLLLVPASAAAQDQGAASTQRQQVDPEGGPVSVTDVRVGSHDGYDRVTFELEGEGLAGWVVELEDEPMAQGSGAPIDVQGATSLWVTLSMVWLPPDAPDDIDQWEGDVAGPAGGVVREVVEDTIFEGNHTFAIGLDEELPFTVQRYEDPQRVVIDVFHDPDGSPVPRDGVDTGAGGTATGSGPMPGPVVSVGLVLLVLLVGAGLLATRSRRA